MKLKHLFALAAIAVSGSAWAQSVGDVLTVGSKMYKIKAANLITNGNFDDGLNGWTNASDWSSALPSDKFSVEKEGTNNYLKGTKNEGSTANGSIGTAWELENNKTYYFSFRIKALGSGTDTGYIKTSLTNAKGTETQTFTKPTAVKDDWKAFEKIIENNTYKYLQCQFRWLNSQWGFDDFMLFEVEEYDPYTDIVTYDNASNLDFATDAVDNMICTYWKDMGSNSTTNSRMQYLSGWIHQVANADAEAAGVFAYKGSAKLGSNDANGAMPNEAPDATSNGNGLGIVAVWGGKAQYAQYVTFPEGLYELTIPVYNVAGTTDFSKNLIGFVEKDGTEHLLTTKKYNVGVWTIEKLRLNFDSDTQGYLTVGYNGASVGSAASQHLFIDRISIVSTTEEDILLGEIADALGTDNANVPTGKMNATIASTLNAKVQAAENATNSNSKTELETILSELNDAIAAANASAANYKKVALINTRAEVLDEAGKNSYATTLVDYNSGNLTQDGEYAQAKQALVTATLAQTSTDADYTGLLVDPSFEEFSDVWNNGWTTDRGTTGNFDYKLYEETLNTNGTTEGKYVLNAWAPQIEHIYVKQTISDLPTGVYTLSAGVYSDKIKDQHVEAIANGKNYKSATVSNNNWETLSTEFIVSAEGEVTIGIYANGENVNGNTNGWFRVDNFKLVRVCDVASATLAVKADKYGTFIAPFAAEKPANVTLYTCDGVDANGYLNLTSVDAVEAGKPYITKSTGEAVDETLYGKATANEDSYTEGLLTGVLDADVKVPNGSYILATKDDVQAFYKVATDNYNAQANKCYITMPEETPAKALYFAEDADAIKTIEALTSGDAKIYNLNGHLLNSLQKGINIVNGRKVMVK